MARPGISEAKKLELAIQAAGKMVSRGERPGYRLTIVADAAGVAWSILGWPDVGGTAGSRRDVPDAARAAIAALIGVPPDAFDVEL